MQLFSVTGGDVKGMSPVTFAEDHVETHIQSWADRYPALINAGYPMVSLGCEITTGHGKSIDNLFIDGDGVLVVAEMKRGKSPYDVLAQTINYAAFVRDLEWARVDALCQKRHGTDLATVFATSFSRAFIMEPKPRHRLLIVAESFDPWIMDGASYLIDKGVPLVLIQFQLFRIGDQSLLQLSPVQGELPEQDQAIASTKSKPIDEGYSGWLMSSVGGKLDELGETQGWPLRYEVKRQSVQFHSDEWPLPLPDCQFRVDLYKRNAISLRFSIRNALARGLEDMLNARKPSWHPSFPANIELPTYETAFLTMTVHRPRPQVGDINQLTEVMAAIAGMTNALRPLIDDYFAGKPQAHASNRSVEIA